MTTLTALLQRLLACGDSPSGRSTLSQRRNGVTVPFHQRGADDKPENRAVMIAAGAGRNPALRQPLPKGGRGPAFSLGAAPPARCAGWLRCRCGASPPRGRNKHPVAAIPTPCARNIPIVGASLPACPPGGTAGCRAVSGGIPAGHARGRFRCPDVAGPLVGQCIGEKLAGTMILFS